MFLSGIPFGHFGHVCTLVLNRVRSLLSSVFYVSVLLLMINCGITLSK